MALGATALPAAAQSPTPDAPPAPEQVAPDAPPTAAPAATPSPATPRPVASPPSAAPAPAPAPAEPPAPPPSVPATPVEQGAPSAPAGESAGRSEPPRRPRFTLPQAIAASAFWPTAVSVQTIWRSPPAASVRPGGDGTTARSAGLVLLLLLLSAAAGAAWIARPDPAASRAP